MKLWNVINGKNIDTFEGYRDPVNSVAFSSDGKTLASGEGDVYIDRFDVRSQGEVKLWDVATGKTNKILKGHREAVLTVAFSPDGKTLASGSKDKTIKLWDVPSGNNTSTLEEHNEDVNSVAFSPDGKILVSGSKDKTIKLWDVASGKTTRTLTGHRFYVFSVAFNPDGKTLASGSSDEINLWDVATGENTGTLKHNGFVHSVVFSPDGKTLASASNGSGSDAEDVGSFFSVVRRYVFPLTGTIAAILGLIVIILIWRRSSNPSAGPEPALKVPNAVQELIAALEDHQVEVRWDAAKKLGRYGPEAKEAVPKLQALLNDTDSLVRRAAAEALDAITAPSQEA